MKRLSIKAKLTVLYSSLMMLLIIFIIGLFFTYSSQEILSHTKAILEEHVSSSFDDIDYKHDSYHFDNDILELEDGVYLSVYDAKTQELVYGRVPYGFAYDLPFADGQVRKIKSNQTKFYVLDMQYQAKKSAPSLMVRGIISISNAQENVYATLRLSLLLLPLFVLVSSIAGYFLAKKALSPVATITQRVQTILKGQNLTKRVALGKGKDEIYEMAETFDKLLAQMEDSLQREQQFTSDVSHELRTPLTTILMQCEQLLHEKQNDEASTKELKVIQQKAIAMRNIISQLLLLSRADMGNAQLTMEPLNFSELSAYAIEEIQLQAEKKQIQVTSDIQNNIMVYGDQTLLIRFWMNVLHNAIQYGKEQGHLFLQVKFMEDHVQIVVDDDGIGITEEQLPYIWNRFYRCDSARNNSTSSGLGLSMVKWIIEAHGGLCDVKSCYGKGTTFTFTLPVLKKDEKL